MISGILWRDATEGDIRAKIMAGAHKFNDLMGFFPKRCTINAHVWDNLDPEHFSNSPFKYKKVLYSPYGSIEIHQSSFFSQHDFLIE